jgi:hypothetical protein
VWSSCVQGNFALVGLLSHKLSEPLVFGICSKDIDSLEGTTLLVSVALSYSTLLTLRARGSGIDACLGVDVQRCSEEVLSCGFLRRGWADHSFLESKELVVTQNR